MKLDPITLELIKNALSSTADQMAFTVVRTSYSIGIKAGMDFSTALMDAQGQMLAQGLCLPLHLGAMPAATQTIMRTFAGDINPGDVFAFNDPFDGGMHLPDIFIIQPVFAGAELIGYAIAVSHHQDVGGRIPGSCAVDSPDVFSEGLRIPPVKLYDAGRANGTLFRLLESNVRQPVKLLGDLRAQLAACHIGADGLLDLARRYGVAGIRAYFTELLDYAERLTRLEITAMPDGVYRFTDWLDDSATVDEPVPIAVTITIEGDRLHADFAGSAPQVRAALNSTFPCTQSGVYLAVKSLLDASIPNNAGFFRPITVTAPPGTIVNPVHPAATGARGLTVFRIVDAILGALAGPMPDRVFAASEGGNSNIRIGGADRQGRPFLLVDILVGAWGGRAGKDGIDGIANIATNLSNAPAELIEAEFPILVQEYGFVPDTGGPGRFRGGLSIARQLHFLGRDAIMQLRSDRRRFRPYGLYGGLPGSPSTNLLNPGTPEEKLLPSKVVVEIRHGDVIRHHTAGAGGYGDPLARDPELVAADVRNEKVSPTHAREAYGVVIDPVSGAVDAAATLALRAARRKEAAPV